MMLCIINYHPNSFYIADFIAKDGWMCCIIALYLGWWV